MKTISFYLFAVLLLGTFQGLLMSMGTHILMSIAGASLFWALMLMPMLRHE